MPTISYMIFVDSNNRRYAINSDDCTTFATDPGDTQYHMFPVDSNDQISKEEPVPVFKSDIAPAGCIVTAPAP